jgi:beta-lactamase regulating signal transducer with metallopeptidase domain
MTMSAFLLLLIKLNLAMGAAIILVSLLRRPLRRWFGTPVAYAIWFLVPIAGLASLFPPRVVVPAPVTPVHVAAAPVFAGHIAQSALQVTEQLAGQNAFTAPLAAPQLAPVHAMPDTALLLFVAWALGALFMALYLTRLQLRFSAAVRAGEAGPAVLGFFRPRIVTPDGFQEHFTPQEQAAILAHERVHLARQDARINALTALLRCLCWFNPLIHLGARWLRIDQELACDATVVAGAVSRRDYASALLKSQMVITTLPLGCSWPGSQHPLIERIALLKRKPAGTARRLAGAGLVVLAATSAGLGAWAAQPPIAAKPAPLPPPVAHMQAKATPNPVMTTKAQGSAEQALPSSTETSTAALPTNQVATNQAVRLAFQTNEAATASATTRLSAAPPLPKEVSASETGAASNDPPATPVQPPPPAVALNDQPVAPIQPTTRDLSVGPVQAASNTPPAAPAMLDTNEPYRLTRCASATSGDSAGFVTGRVTSSTTIQMPILSCLSGSGSAPEGGGNNGGGGSSIRVGFGPGFRCANPIRRSVWGYYCPNRPWATLTVQLANPSDARKMPLGKLVTLRGDFSVITQNKVQYWFVLNAKVLYADPFGR